MEDKAIAGVAEGINLMDNTGPPRRRLLTGAAAVAGATLFGSAIEVPHNAAAVPPEQSAGDTGPKVLRTPEAWFAGLPDYPFEPNYVQLDLGDGSRAKVRMHYVDTRPADPAKASGETILLLHGNPSWRLPVPARHPAAGGGGAPLRRSGPDRAWQVRQTD